MKGQTIALGLVAVIGGTYLASRMNPAPTPIIENAVEAAPAPAPVSNPLDLPTGTLGKEPIVNYLRARLEYRPARRVLKAVR